AGRAAIGIDVLAEQVDLAYSLLGEPGHFDEDVLERTRDLLATGVGHDAEAAVLAAAFHDRDEGRRGVDARRRQAVELLDLGEADVDLGAAAAAPLADELRQPVQGLRAEDHVDIGRPGDDRRALLAGHATTHADHQAGLVLLEDPRPAQVRE